MKKKLLAVTLCLTMILSLSACGKDVKGTVEKAQTEQSDSKGKKVTKKETKKIDQPASEKETESETEETELALGSTEANIYTSEFLGLTAAFGTDWTFYEEQQLAQLNGVAADSMTDEQIKEQMKSADLIYDMYVINNSTGASANIVLQDIGAMGGMFTTEEASIEASLSQVQTALESSGVTDLNITQTTVELAGETRNALHVEGVTQGLKMYEDLVVKKVGNYMASITFACFNENTLADAESAFAALP